MLDAGGKTNTKMVIHITRNIFQNKFIFDWVNSELHIVGTNEHVQGVPEKLTL